MYLSLAYLLILKYSVSHREDSVKNIIDCEKEGEEVRIYKNNDTFI